ncbi:MAG: serine/threonine-protein kinase [Myxococcaceae bacterium]
MAENPVDIESGTLIAGKYRVAGLLGQGGMGSVYQAVNADIGRKVALKLLDPRLANLQEFMHRFQMEARAAAMIGHPGIVDVLDMGKTEEGAPFIVMEYLEGATLRLHLKKHGPLSPGAAAAIIAPVLDALAAAHTAGVIHRDLKPANIFLVSKPVPGVKILDFGISKFGAGSASVTATGTTLGTPAYMAPEQVRGSRELTASTDLYAVGAVLYNMLCGHPPFEADSDFALVARVLTEEHRSLGRARPDIPKPLAALVDSLLAKDPDTRPHDAQVVRKSLLTVVRPDADAVWRHAASWYEAPPRATPPPSSKIEPLGQTNTTPATNPTRNSRPPGQPQGGAAKRLALVSVGAAALALGALGYVLISRAHPEPLVEAPAPPPAPSMVVLTLRADPDSARWTVDGALLDCNPCEVSGAKGARVNAKVSADERIPRELELLLDETREVKVVLDAVPRAQPPEKGPKKNLRPGRGLAIDENNPYRK